MPLACPTQAGWRQGTSARGPRAAQGPPHPLPAGFGSMPAQHGGVPRASPPRLVSPLGSTDIRPTVLQAVLTSPPPLRLLLPPRLPTAPRHYCMQSMYHIPGGLKFRAHVGRELPFSELPVWEL